MMAHKKMDWSKALTFILFLFSFPAVAFADWEDILAKFRPRITVQEQYIDNLFYTNTDRVSDYITTISPGLTFSATENKEIKYGLDLDYAPGFVSYAHNSQLNYVSQAGTLNTFYTFGQHLTLRARDYFNRSDNPLLSSTAFQPTGAGVYSPGMLGTGGYSPGILGAGGYYLGTNQTRTVYTQNIFEPSLTYQFGPEDRFEFIFQETDFFDPDPTIGNFHLDTFTPRLTYWFNIHNGIILEYRFLNANYQLSPDSIDQRGRARYTYRFTPQTSIFGEYIFDAVNYEYPGVSYYVQNPSIGITHAFTPTLSGRAQVGYFFQTQAGNTSSSPTFDSGISLRTVQTTFDLAFRGGYMYAIGITPQTAGFTKYYQGMGTIRQQLATRLSVGIVGSLGRYEFTAQPSNQIDWIWQVQGFLSYQLLRWLTASFTISHLEDNSNLDSASYKVNTAMIRLTAGGPNFLGAYPPIGSPAGGYPGGGNPSGMYP